MRVQLDTGGIAPLALEIEKGYLCLCLQLCQQLHCRGQLLHMLASLLHSQTVTRCYVQPAPESIRMLLVSSTKDLSAILS